MKNIMEIEECFITFVAMSQLDSANMSEAILNHLYKMNLDVKRSIIGMRFDGASVMSGKRTVFEHVYVKLHQRLTMYTVIITLLWSPS